MKADEALNPHRATAATTLASPLLALEEGANRARALRWWRVADLQAIGARFDALVDAWSQDWLGARREPHAVAREGRFEAAAASPAPARWHQANPVATASGDVAARGPVAGLHETLFGDTRVTPRSPGDHPVVAEEIVRIAWQDWRDRLSDLCPGLLLSEGAASTGGLTTALPWSGEVIVQVPWCGGEWQIALEGERIAALLAGTRVAPLDATGQQTQNEGATRPSVASMQTALIDEPIRLRAELHGVTLTLGQFHALRAGDVVVLEHALDEPLPLLCDDRTFVCHGWLGQQHGRLALELAA